MEEIKYNDKRNLKEMKKERKKRQVNLLETKKRTNKQVSKLKLMLNIYEHHKHIYLMMRNEMLF